MGDVGDVLAARDDELEDGVAEESACGVDGDGSNAGCLAQLVAGGRSTGKGLEVDAQQGEVSLVARPRVPGFGA
ncbi:MAG: hypothetical protein M5T61_02510 [Acidimicrobiia bacterium]|nr:hypothetical protein [Acidimicrobiia bacterium]